MKLTVRKNWIVLACALLALGLAACTPPAGDLPSTGEEPGVETQPPASETPAQPETEMPGGEGRLDNTYWRLVSLEEHEEAVPVLAGTQVTLEFGEAGLAGGSGGCNSFGTRVVIVEDTISFGEIETTEIACTAPGVLEQEQRYYAGLREAEVYELEGDQLRIRLGVGEGILHFIREEPGGTPAVTPETGGALTNTHWRLESFGPVGSPQPVQPGAEITLEFDAAGQAGGSGGCNSYGGSYQVQGAALSFGAINSTLMACADENLNDQEGRYFQALQSVEGFELSPDGLMILYDGGQGALNFVSE